MASVVDTSVKVFKSSQLGAPVLSGSAGALIAVLDACLVNGWGLKTLDSLIINNNVATMNIASGHSFIINSVVLITGATPAALNGEQRITSITGNSASFAVAGLSNQTATGSITAKIAPVGWTKAFSGTNLAAYKSTDVTSTGDFLRVDDTAAVTARVVGYETMTDINTGVGAFPLSAQTAGGLYWSKSEVASASGREWVIYADSKGLLYCVKNMSAYGFYPYAFGDINPTRSNDPFCCYLSGDISTQHNNNPTNAGMSLIYSSVSSTTTNVIARSYTGLGGSTNVSRYAFNFVNSNYSSGTMGLVYPNPSNGGLYVSPVMILENSCFRGVMFGLHHIPQNIPSGTFNSFDTVTNVSSMAGRTLDVLCMMQNTHPYVIDVTGPWR